ncbi:MAG: DUF6460 domain-containing protein [Methylovirgula sp.]
MIDEHTAQPLHWSVASSLNSSANASSGEASNESSNASANTSSEAWRWRQTETPLTRFLGGTPANVALRLILLSIIVGALLMWLDIRPIDVIETCVRFARRVWAMGFDAIRELGTYVLAGAMIVVPVWLVLRLFNLRRLR